MNRLISLRPNRCARWLLTGAFLVGGAVMMMNMASADVRIARECADADLRQLNWIEARAQENRMSGQQLHEAFVAVIEARKLCVADQAREGVAAYEAISVADASSARGPQPAR